MWLVSFWFSFVYVCMSFRIHVSALSVFIPSCGQCLGGNVEFSLGGCAFAVRWPWQRSYLPFHGFRKRVISGYSVFVRGYVVRPRQFVLREEGGAVVCLWCVNFLLCKWYSRVGRFILKDRSTNRDVVFRMLRREYSFHGRLCLLCVQCVAKGFLGPGRCASNVTFRYYNVNLWGAQVCGYKCRLLRWCVQELCVSIQSNETTFRGGDEDVRVLPIRGHGAIHVNVAMCFVFTKDWPGAGRTHLRTQVFVP